MYYWEVIGGGWRICGCSCTYESAEADAHAAAGRHGIERYDVSIVMKYYPSCRKVIRHGVVCGLSGSKS